MGIKISALASVGAPLGTDQVEISREVSPGVWQTFRQALGNSQLLGFNEIGYGNAIGLLDSDSNFTWNAVLQELEIGGKTTIIGTLGNNVLDIYDTFLNSLFRVEDDGFVSIRNGDLTFSTVGGFSKIDVPNYLPFKLSMSGSYGDFIVLSNTVGDIHLVKQTRILGGITPTSDTSLDIGAFGGTSSVGVRNVSLDSSGTGSAVYSIGKQGSGGLDGSATMRFINDPVSFGAGINDESNNYHRIGIGMNSVSTHRVVVADGLKVSTGGMDSNSYSVGGVAGANFGPGVVTSITVVNGIITAIS